MGDQRSRGFPMMLMALLGQEIPIINGKYSNPYVGTIPYASQTPAILPSSLRENITFGESYVEDALQRALKGAALLPDMQQLPNNDLTEIGEHGVNLSGWSEGSPGICTGAYAAQMKKEESGLVILDDILAACDVHVSAQIVKTGIKMLIDSGMIVVLSMSSQFTLLQHAGIDAAMHITMEAGRVKNIEKVMFHRSLDGCRHCRHYRQV